MKRGEILDSVKKTITQDRNDRHGEPENTFPRIAEAWTDYLVRNIGGYVSNGLKLKPSDVAELMAIFKTCRFENQPDNSDNEHDRIGYYAIAAELRAAERPKNTADKSVLEPDKVAAGVQEAKIPADWVKNCRCSANEPHFSDSCA